MVNLIPKDITYEIIKSKNPNTEGDVIIFKSNKNLGPNDPEAIKIYCSYIGQPDTEEKFRTFVLGSEG
jgi:hypothetical protein